MAKVTLIMAWALDPIRRLRSPNGICFPLLQSLPSQFPYTFEPSLPASSCSR